MVFALDRASGKEQWRREVPRHRRAARRQRAGVAIPVTDGHRVYAFFQDSG